MVARKFSILLKENTAPCMFTATLSRTASRCLDSLAYIEIITDATSHIEQTENKCVKIANYHFNQCSASASQCSLIISAESTANDKQHTENNKQCQKCKL